VGERVAFLSRRQGGAVSHEQLVAHGVGHDRIHRLSQQGWLVREQKGVYRLGALMPDGVLWAALLAAGPDAVLSHRSSGHEHAVLRGRLPQAIDVTASTRRRSRNGIACTPRSSTRATSRRAVACG